MKFETLASIPQTPESEADRKKVQCIEAITAYRSLAEATAEALEQDPRLIIGGESYPAKTPEELKMAALQLEKEALLGEAEKFAAQGKSEAERAARMLAELVGSSEQILGLYLDAIEFSPALAGVIAESHPWVKNFDNQTNDNEQAKSDR